MSSCRKHFPKKPIIVKNKVPCKCQGICLMREFRKKHEKKCKSVEISEPTRKTKDFYTGSSYEGDWSPGYGMHGLGVYTFPNGVVYEGEFKEGTMHGKGELRYQTPIGRAIIVHGQWNNGVLADRTILFDEETLEYEVNDWQYCKMPDRRYSAEYADGLQPGGMSFLTAYQPPIQVPENCYDTGDGIYDRKRQMVYDYNDLTKIIRYPSSLEKKWIKENCRMGDENMSLGPRPDFYETYVEPTLLLEPKIPPAAKYIEKLPKEPTFCEESNARFWPKEIYTYRKYKDSKKNEVPDSTVQISSAKIINTGEAY